MEVYLIKGKYYTFSQDYHMVPLCSHGAIEGSVVVDRSIDIFPYLDFCPDITLIRHSGKWGFLRKIEILGMGCANWASDNDQPFIYDDVRVTRHGDVDGEYILLKKDNKWGVVKTSREELAPVYVNEVAPFIFDSCEDAFRSLGLTSTYKINPEPQHLLDYSEDLEFDCQKDFMYYWGFNEYEALGPVLGETEYLTNMSFLKAAARHNPYATFLIGKELFNQAKSRIKDLGLKFLKTEADDRDEVKGAHGMFLCAKEYFDLSLKYAQAEGNKTMEDISKYFLEAEIKRYLQLTSPDKKEKITFRKMKKDTENVKEQSQEQ